jgi:hypothetical protein
MVLYLLHFPLTPKLLNKQESNNTHYVSFAGHHTSKPRHAVNPSLTLRDPTNRYFTNPLLFLLLHIILSDGWLPGELGVESEERREMSTNAKRQNDS